MNTLVEAAPTATPTENDSRQAKDASRRLAAYLQEHRSFQVQLSRGEGPGESIELPAAASRLLVDVLAHMGQGNAVTVTPISAELTTQQAAGILKVSRPYLIGLLTDGQIPFRMVGTHRRVLLDDLTDYKKRDDQVRLTAAKELIAQAQELDMGY